MSGSPQVAVRGEAHLEVDPEIARLIVTVHSRDKDRSKALRGLTTGLSGAQELLKGYGDAVESVESRALSVHPEFEGNRKGQHRQIVAYNGRSTLSVRVGDFTVLGDMVLRLGERDLLTVSGPYWDLRPSSTVHQQARLEAVRDARVRASEYAQAAGGRLTGLVEIADVGLSGGRPEPMAFAAAAPRGMAAGSVADEVQLDLTPARQHVHATVEVRFLMSEPDFSQD